uniref:Uncharacterized protein n=1 Tax=Meloidogyne enterolobii TaxID=390850 RepID=A0A6V7XQE1_MELEN|nr:unnamed protein product [Meloidogyne enterolobii]
MKSVNILFFLIFNSILWSLINSVKNNKNQNDLTRVEEISKDLTEILNDGAESSAVSQIQKYKETIKPKHNIPKKEKTGNDEGEKGLKRKKYDNDYYQRNKEKICRRQRNYNIKNKEKRSQISKKYYQENKKRLNERSREYKRKYRLRKKIEKESQQNDIGVSYLQKDTPIQSSHREEGPPSVNPQNNCCENEQENIQDGHFNQQLNDWNDLVDLNLLEDEKFLDYLNEVLES